MGKQYANLAEKKNPWRDTQIRLTGACVATLDAYFMTDFLCAVRQRDWEYMVEYMKSLKLPPQQTSQNLCQFVVSGVDNDKEAAKMNYLSMIRSAKRRSESSRLILYQMLRFLMLLKQRLHPVWKLS